MDEFLSSYEFELPEDRVAPEPAAARDSAKLLRLRSDGAVEHRVFRELPELLRRGDCLVLNRTKVLPVRLPAWRPTGGKAELLVLGGEGGLCRVLARGAKAGDRLELAGGQSARLLARESDGAWTCEFSIGDVPGYLSRYGLMPLPPYILKRRPARASTEADSDRYQTVYAESDGSIAAPTAGLHFTPELLARLEAGGVRIERLVLHIGWATFKPVACEDLAEHRMPAERFEIPERVAQAVKDTRRAGGRVVAVGTSVTRSLETAAEAGWRTLAGASELFIRPGRSFLAIDALVTNFHLPKSSPLLLACAFAGRERLLAAYREAVRAGYRFYSYGDSTFLEPAA